MLFIRQAGTHQATVRRKLDNYESRQDGLKRLWAFI